MADLVEAALVAVAAAWGVAAGALLPRAAHRFAVPDGEPWRSHCPGGHPLRGWLGRVPCGTCARTPAAAPLDPTGTPHPGAAGEPRPPETRTADPAATGQPYPAAADEPHSATTRQPYPAESRAADPAAAARPHPAETCAADPGATGEPYFATTTGQPYPVTTRQPYVPSGLSLAGVTAVVCAALALVTGARPELAVWLVLAPAGVLLGAVDLRVRRLPDPLTLPLAAAALALLGVAALLPEHAGHWPTALYGALALGGGYLALFLVNPAGMGFGDVKLALGAGAVLGWYGWPTVLLGTFAGFVSGALYGGALVVLRRADRGSAIPFGPFLLAGAFAGLLAGAFTA
ncbi:prepilin peptidase [Streptomyces sp. NPDC090108]|uniref:prepilin peptidase n=1 Tax=Streptomyces sp. NPDC090108 TaxID=3365947 RepID=UPI00381A3045